MPPDKLEQKINLLLENLAAGERAQALSQENQQLKSKVQRLEKQIPNYQKPVGNTPDIFQKVTAYIVGGMIVIGGLLIAGNYVYLACSPPRRLHFDLQTREDEGCSKMDQFNLDIYRNPKNAEAYEQRAKCFFSRAQYNLAIDDYTKAISFGDHSNLDFLYLLQSLHFWRGKAWEMEGRTMDSQGDHHTAEIYYQRAEDDGQKAEEILRELEWGGENDHATG